MPRSNKLVLPSPAKRNKWKHLRGDGKHSLRRLVWGGGVDDGHATVVCNERQCITGRRKGDRVNPATRLVCVFAADSVEGDTLSPSSRLGALVDALDERGEDSGVGICGAGGKKDRVWMPGEGEDGRAEGLLDVLGYPPVVLLFKVANGNHTGTGANGEFSLVRRPTDVCRCTIDPQKNKSGLPPGGRGFPDKGITV